MIYRKVSINDFESIKTLLRMFHDEFLDDLGLNMVDSLYDKIFNSPVFQTSWVAIDPKQGVVGIFAGNDQICFRRISFVS